MADAAQVRSMIEPLVVDALCKLQREEVAAAVNLLFDYIDALTLPPLPATAPATPPNSSSIAPGLPPDSAPDGAPTLAPLFPEDGGTEGACPVDCQGTDAAVTRDAPGTHDGVTGDKRRANALAAREQKGDHIDR